MPIMPEALYTVQPDDEGGGLTQIAYLIYGSPDRWTTIYEANQHIVGSNPNVIRAGQQLVLPDLLSEIAAPGAAFVYIVQPADLPEGLAGIALRHMGGAQHWERLYRINRGVIGEDPQRLQPGQCLLILAP
ncbi:MAG: LysM peptidoglycan-binding domain-containing protein [Chloroflexales bacterium]|nr:LysM peptidoglycan-binding domain-containing protein [Chloroflexales bacterium]